MFINDKINLFIENQFSSFFRENASTLINFIEVYYKWMSENGVLYNTHHLQSYNDVDLIPDKFIDFLRYEFMSDIPKNLLIDQRFLMKNIVDFYQAKGTESAHRLLFRMLFNEEINIYYPGNDILRASDGRWYVGKYYIIETDLSLDKIKEISLIKGELSGATAKIENLEFINDKKIFISNQKGNFILNEFLFDFFNTQKIGKIVSDIYIQPGKYIGTYGFLSSDKYIQDNDYYQEFSYEIQSSKSISSYQNIVKKLVHPAGIKLFGKNITNVVIDEYDHFYYETSTTLHNNFIYVVEANTVVSEVKTTNEIEYRTHNSISVPSGTIHITNNSDISYYSNNISFYNNVPIGLFGTSKLVIGSNTNFLSYYNQAIDKYILIKDVSNNSNIIYEVDKVFNNNFLSIKNVYQYDTLAPSEYEVVVQSTDLIEFNYESSNFYAYSSNNYVISNGDSILVFY